MKKMKKCAMLIGMLAMMLLGAIQVMAADSNTVTEKLTVTLYPETGTKTYGKFNMTKNKNYVTMLEGTVTNLKSSDTSVVKTEVLSHTEEAWYDEDGEYYPATTYNTLYVTAQKAGTATVTFTSGGTNYSYKVTVKKYKDPVSYIKIGSTKIKGTKFKNKSVYTLKYSSFKNKKRSVSIKLAKGWTLWPFYPSKSNKNTINYVQPGWQKNSAIKNGKTVKIKGGGFLFGFVAYNKSTGQSVEVDVVLK